MRWLEDLAGEFAISIGNGGVWLSIGQGLVVGLVCLVLGAWLARRAGLLDPNAPAGETLAVGLSVGLVAVIAWFAAIESDGRSAFTPVAIGFAGAFVLAIVRPTRARPADEPRGTEGPTSSRALSVGALGGAVFIIVVAHLYGSTMALSPRDGVQPVEFMDEAFYSVLAADLARTGTESTLSPAGLGEIAGASAQNWYHWGEIWLAAGVIKAFDAEPLQARHFSVLPLVLLAAALLTGTLVRRLNRTGSTGAFLVGFMVCLFLAPIPWLPGPFFSNWAVGLLFGVTVYGMAAVAVPLAILALLRRPQEDAWTFAALVGSAIAFILPGHLVIAALAVVGIATAVGIRLVRRSIRKEPIDTIPRAWHRTAQVASVLVVTSLAWGFLTGHGLGGTGVSAGVDPFNASWRDSLLTIVLGGGAFYAIAAAWWLARRQERPEQVTLYVSAIAVVAVAALIWGARLGDFNMFHVFFGSIAVFATTVTAVAIWVVWTRARATRRPGLWITLALFVSLQLEVGGVLTVLRLQRFGPGNYEPVPLELLTVMRSLPADATIAYRCRFDEEVSYWDARLLAIGVHAGRRIVPMCFEADSFGVMVGGPSTREMSPLFATAPHRILYPDADAQPSSEAVEAFMREHGIDYIYADRMHPNGLVPAASVIAKVGDFELLRLP